ncbi:solute:sodium symporter family transporter [Rheinheimera sp. UJ51]|uniref:solute:sodium symporter family transporter n=1 Tax=Rheinheimera sp. UJ51 TaxID=2892446 RepID=UPI001E430DDA|nr:solute:sodium symporter family transporter [Rheinheimera sp. UJ51]MCC5452910.1 solute:sodium symporter family transporter [Rheinheimera sp. UJ51]
MTTQQITFTLLSCIFFMVLVAWISYQKTKGVTETKEGYFLAGRGLTGTFIAGSMLLTNLSAEQLIGLNGSAFGYNLSAMAWEVTAGIATILMALVFLPRYLSGAFTTLPEFLKQRFDDSVRRMTVVLFMIGYGLITIPSVLYSGSVAVLKLFDVPQLLGLSYSASLIVTIVLIGSIGAIYAIFGGLKAVAVSDTINGVGLLIIGVTVPVLGFVMLGDGSFSRGVATVLTTHTDKLNAIGAASDPVPFGTIFTGMIIANLFYWCTNQYVIQRSLGAKNLAEGQKGVLLSGYFKLLVPFMMMMPGVIAFHLYQQSHLETIDAAYPRLVKDVLPIYMAGFFLAVLLGTVFSSFNSLLNSAATLFCLDVYAPLKKDKVSDKQLIFVAKIASLIIALFSFFVAPLLMFAQEGLWQIIRVFTGFYNIPVITIVIIGLFTRRVPAIAAKTVILFHVVTYGLLKFVLDVDIHFIHMYAILFVVEVAIMLLFGYYQPMETAYSYEDKHAVSMVPWRYAHPVSINMVALIVISYLFFSDFGVVSGDLTHFYWLSAVVMTLNLSLCYLSIQRWNRKHLSSVALG